MAPPADVVDLLSRGGTAWRTAQGVSRHWRNQPLVVRAFDEYFGRLEAAGRVVWTVTVTCDDDAGEPDVVIETVLAFALDRLGHRRRVELLGWKGEELRADLVVIDGDSFWARTGEQVQTNGGNPHHGHGGTEAADLLQPALVPSLFHLQPHDDEQLVAGRACWPVRARRRENPAPEHQGRPDPFGMIAGGQDFCLFVDAAAGVLLRVVKLVAGDVAELCEFTELAFDEPFADGLFQPLS